MKYMKEKITREVTDKKTGAITRETVERTTFQLVGLGTLLSIGVAFVKALGLM